MDFDKRRLIQKAWVYGGVLRQLLNNRLDKTDLLAVVAIEIKELPEVFYGGVAIRRSSSP